MKQRKIPLRTSVVTGEVIPKKTIIKNYALKRRCRFHRSNG